MAAAAAAAAALAPPPPGVVFPANRSWRYRTNWSGSCGVTATTPVGPAATTIREELAVGVVGVAPSGMPQEGSDQPRRDRSRGATGLPPPCEERGAGPCFAPLRTERAMMRTWFLSLLLPGSFNDNRGRRRRRRLNSADVHRHNHHHHHHHHRSKWSTAGRYRQGTAKHRIHIHIHLRNGSSSSSSRIIHTQQPRRTTRVPLVPQPRPA